MSEINPAIVLTPEVAQLSESVIALRRRLHQWPELGFQERQTGKLIAEQLTALGVDVRSDCTNGGVGILQQNGEGRPLLRADIDGLPIEEQVVRHMPLKIMVSCMRAGTTGTQLFY